MKEYIGIRPDFLIGLPSTSGEASEELRKLTLPRVVATDSGFSSYSRIHLFFHSLFSFLGFITNKSTEPHITYTSLKIIYSTIAKNEFEAPELQATLTQLLQQETYPTLRVSIRAILNAAPENRKQIAAQQVQTFYIQERNSLLPSCTGSLFEQKIELPNQGYFGETNLELAKKALEDDLPEKLFIHLADACLTLEDPAHLQQLLQFIDKVHSKRLRVVGPAAVGFSHAFTLLLDRLRTLPQFTILPPSLANGYQIVANDLFPEMILPFMGSEEEIQKAAELLHSRKKYQLSYKILKNHSLFEKRFDLQIKEILQAFNEAPEDTSQPQLFRLFGRRKDYSICIRAIEECVTGIVSHPEEVAIMRVETIRKLSPLFSQPLLEEHLDRLLRTLLKIRISSILSGATSGEREESLIFFILRSLIELSPNEAGHHFRLGTVLIDAEYDTDELRSSFQRALELNPALHHRICALGYFRSLKSDREFAETTLREYYPTETSTEDGRRRLILTLKEISTNRFSDEHFWFDA